MSICCLRGIGEQVTCRVDYSEGFFPRLWSLSNKVKTWSTFNGFGD